MILRNKNVLLIEEFNTTGLTGKTDECFYESNECIDGHLVAFSIFWNSMNMLTG